MAAVALIGGESKDVRDLNWSSISSQQVSRLMNLIVHSLYTRKAPGTCNTSDALYKLRFLSVTDPSSLGDAGELEIRIKPDPEKRTITICIGMTREELIDCLGTIAQSGTSKFLNALKENKDIGSDKSLIGQFGVGFGCFG